MNAKFEDLEDLEAVEAWDFAVDFEVDGDDIRIVPTARWASDDSAGYAAL